MEAIPGEFLDIDRKERVHKPHRDLVLRDPLVRVRDFDDVVIPLTPEQAMEEASRCIHCPDPAPCMSACPAHNDIPSAIWLIEKGKFREAAEIYRKTSTLPEMCGRVCPHEQLCQGSCSLNKINKPILTGQLEVFATEWASAVKPFHIKVGKPSGKNVAIVGAGPAGLAAARILRKKGHDVTIFDAKPSPGGLLTYGIPNFKLPKDAVFNKWQEYEAAGVKFIGNTYIGQDKTIDELFEDGFNAVFLGIGTGIDAKMEIPGEELDGVYEATDFLIRGNVNPDHLPADKSGHLPVGKKVVVIGGGDTASDCLRTALRLDAEEVTCLYRRTEKEMPGGKKDRQMARDERAKYRFLVQPVKFVAGEDGKLAYVECLEMKLGEPDAKGRRKPVAMEGSNFMVEADTAVKALGYWPDPTIGKTTPNMETHDWGLISVPNKETGQTSRKGVFAAGDVVTGPDLVVTAMVAGQKVAEAIDAYLTNLD
jgi:glutamate synthase (NADPH/NADH) small chain